MSDDLSDEVRAIMGIFEDFGWRISTGIGMGVNAGSIYGFKHRSYKRSALHITVVDGRLIIRDRPRSDRHLFDEHLGKPGCLDDLEMLLEVLDEAAKLEDELNDDDE
jgi:hypothetical protein